MDKQIGRMSLSPPKSRKITPFQVKVIKKFISFLNLLKLKDTNQIENNLLNKHPDDFGGNEEVEARKNDKKPDRHRR